MTNEELAAQIQAGERDKLPELWSQVEQFVRQQARRRAYTLEGVSDITAEDLYHAGYLGMIKAVERYDPKYSFLSCLQYCLMNAFNEAANYRSERQRKDPIHSHASLYTPLTEDEENSTTLGDTIEDLKALQQLDEVEFYASIEKVLTPLQQAVVLAKYCHGLTMEQTSQALGMDTTQVAKIARQAVRVLRRSMK